jgi:peptidoglycan/LPS O-acetylase OafA/YrhL
MNDLLKPRNSSLVRGHQKDHLPYLDALRGFAALAVIMVHCCVLTSIDGGFIGTVGISGQRGVQLFYVISAFTLCYSFDLRRHDEKFPLRNYFTRRFFRIAPLFYAAVIANLLYQGLAPREEAPNGLAPWDILLGVFFLNGFHPETINSIALGGWSIAVETTFYILLPLILSHVKTLKRSILLLVISAPLAYGLSRGFFQANLTREYFLFYWFPVQFPVFAMGIFAYFFWKSYFKDNPVTHPRILSLYLLANFFVIFWVNLPISDYKLYLNSCAFIPLIWGLSLCQWKIFVNPVTVYLGKISYSIYLTHLFFLKALPHVWLFAGRWISFQPAGSRTVCILSFFGVALAAAALSTLTYYFIEKPGIRFGGKLIEKWERHAVLDRI